jgi:predicted DNA-binding protein (UPF0251 family)
MVAEGMIAMSGKERDRLRVIEAVRERRLKQGEVAARVGLSVRQVKRLVRAHRKRVFQLRERRASVGEGVQIVGSPHTDCPRLTLRPSIISTCLLKRCPPRARLPLVASRISSTTS